jgi:hypothetical protein
MTGAAMAPSGRNAASRSGQDVLELLDYAWSRFTERMAGLADDELAWQPTADDRITPRWRLDHVASSLTEDRNEDHRRQEMTVTVPRNIPIAQA